MKTIGTKVLKASFTLAIFVLLIPIGKSQEVGFSLMAYPSAGYNLVFEPGMNGTGVSVFYNRQKFKKLNLSLSGEYAVTTWGNQAFFGLGINRTWISQNRFQLGTYGHLLNGIAFYKPKSLYVFGVDTRMVANYYLFQDIKLFLGLGVRYTLNPGYRDYGIIETSLDLPLELGMKFSIKY